MKKNFRILGIAFFIAFSSLYAQSFNGSQVLSAGHWIYDYLKILGMEQKTVCFNENSMMTVSEIRFYFEQLFSCHTLIIGSSTSIGSVFQESSGNKELSIWNTSSLHSE